MGKRKRVVKRDASHQDVDDDAGSGSATSTEGSPATEDDLLVKTVNQMPTREFREHYINDDMLNYDYSSGTTIKRNVTLQFKAAADLSKDELSACFTLIEKTSRVDYEPSSFGWHPKRKRREMAEEEMRYLLVRDPASDEEGAVVGFMSFMMTHDSTPSVPVLYIYEVHLEERLRKSGLGSHLIKLAEDVAATVGVEKVMLTCFLSNERALAFYRKRGYEKDACSPDDRETRRKVVKVDYVIMSKSVESAVSQHASSGAERGGSSLLGVIRGLTSKLAGDQLRSGEDVAQMRGWV